MFLFVGTRIILFGLRKDIPYLRITAGGKVTFSSLRNPNLFDIPTAQNSRAQAFSQTKEDVRMQDVTTTVEDGSKGASINGMESKKEKCTTINLPNDLSNFSVELSSPVQLPALFPLWTKPIDSLDYNLATYLFWCQLHSKAKLYINGEELKANSSVCLMDGSQLCHYIIHNYPLHQFLPVSTRASISGSSISCPE